jgi:membrane protein YqaA with SNARE-associated domain
VVVFWLSLSTFGVCLASGFIPLINAEIYLLAASAASPSYATVPLLVMGTLGQMTAKVVMYLGGSGVLRLPTHRHADRMHRVMEELQRWRGSTATMIFVSASVGLPPFYVVSVLCGMMRTGLWQFILLGTAARMLRFSVFVFFPELVKGTLP